MGRTIDTEILERIELKREYAMEKDDRTWSNRETQKGYWVDGYYQCYKDIMEILKDNNF